MTESIATYNEARLLEYWRETHGVEVSVEEIRDLIEFGRSLQDQRRLELAKLGIRDPSEEIENRRIVTAIAFGVVGFLIGGIAGVGIGLSLWRAFNRPDEAEEERIDQERNAPTAYGFDSTAQITPVGGVIPIIYCDRTRNPTGGNRVSGSLISSRVDTFLGSQTLFSLQSLCLGPIGAIDINSVRINENPLRNFYRDEVQVQTRLGFPNQSIIDWFNVYSRCISPRSNTALGIDRRGSVRQPTRDTLLFLDDDDEFDNFSPSDNYTSNGQSFNIVGKDEEQELIIANRRLILDTGAEIYANYRATYETLAPCSTITVNLVITAWARDDRNRLVKHGYVWDVFLSPANEGFRNLGRLYCSNRSQSQIRRAFTITNLPFRKYILHLIPGLGHGGGEVYKLGDVGRTRRISTGQFIGGREAIIEIEQTEFTQRPSSTNRNTSFADKESTSSDSGPPIRITTINEISRHWDFGQRQMIAYPRLALLGTRINASERIQSSPRISVVVTRGRVVRFLRAAGTAGLGSSGRTLRDFSARFNSNFFPLAAGHLVLNLRNGLISGIGRIDSVNQLITSRFMSWQAGDDYLIFTFEPSNYLPDIAADLLIDPDYGRGQTVDWRSDIDYPSFIKSKIFCAQNNLYWDGVLERAIPWKQFVAQEAVSCLLYPITIDNKNGLAPEQVEDPVALFHTGDILEYRLESVTEEPINTVIAVYNDGSDGLFNEQSVTIQTTAAFNGSVRAIEETLELRSCTNVNQAIRVAQVYLKTRIIARKRVIFRTGLEAITLRPANVFAVSDRTTEFGAETSGYVTSSSVSGSERVLTLSTPLTERVTRWSHRIAMKNLENNQVATNLRGETFNDNGTVRLRLYSPPWAIADHTTYPNRPGDYIVINSEIDLFRAVRIVPRYSDMTFEITGDSWNPDILSPAGLVTVF